MRWRAAAGTGRPWGRTGMAGRRVGCGTWRGCSDASNAGHGARSGYGCRSDNGCPAIRLGRLSSAKETRAPPEHRRCRSLNTAAGVHLPSLRCLPDQNQCRFMRARNFASTAQPDASPITASTPQMGHSAVWLPSVHVLDGSGRKSPAAREASTQRTRLDLCAVQSGTAMRSNLVLAHKAPRATARPSYAQHNGISPRALRGLLSRLPHCPTMVTPPTPAGPSGSVDQWLIGRTLGVQVPQPLPSQAPRSTRNRVHRQPALRRLLVLRRHIAPGLAHGSDHLVQADMVDAVPV